MFSPAPPSTAYASINNWSDLIDMIRLSIKFKTSIEPRGSLSYVLKNGKNAQTILCIGTYRPDELLLLKKTVGSAGKLLVLVPEEPLKNKLSKVARLFGWVNVTIEQIELSAPIDDFVADDAKDIESLKKEAPVIHIKDRKVQNDRSLPDLSNMEKKLEIYNTIVHTIYIRLNAGSLKVLQAAEKIIAKYQPQLVMEWQEKQKDKNIFLKAIGFITDLKYRGFFVLDTINIPLRNFDFEIYQNPRSDFYCDTFVFKI